MTGTISADFCVSHCAMIQKVELRLNNPFPTQESQRKYEAWHRGFRWRHCCNHFSKRRENHNVCILEERGVKRVAKRYSGENKEKKQVQKIWNVIEIWTKKELKNLAKIKEDRKKEMVIEKKKKSKEKESKEKERKMK